MFGLKYILQTFNVTPSELAQEMKINRANVSMWIRSRRIPEQKITFLSSKFPNIPKEYFTKELSPSEKLTVQEIFLTHTDEWDVVEEVLTDDKGNEHVVEHHYSQHQGIIRHLQEEQEKASLLERVEKVIWNEPQYEEFNKKIVKNFVVVLERNDDDQIAALKMVLSLLKSPTEIDFGGIDPTLAVSKQFTELYRSMRDLFEQHGITNQHDDEE